MTPKGNPLTGINPDSLWFAYVPQIGCSDIEATIRNANSQLSDTRDYLLQLTVTGGVVEYFIGIFFDDSNIGITLGRELILECSGLNISIAFDIYGPELTNTRP